MTLAFRGVVGHRDAIAVDATDDAIDGAIAVRRRHLAAGRQDAGPTDSDRRVLLRADAADVSADGHGRPREGHCARITNVDAECPGSRRARHRDGPASHRERRRCAAGLAVLEQVHATRRSASHRHGDRGASHRGRRVADQVDARARGASDREGGVGQGQGTRGAPPHPACRSLQRSTTPGWPTSFRQQTTTPVPEIMVPVIEVPPKEAAPVVAE